MGKRKSSRRKHTASGTASNVSKGRMIEAIVARMHQRPGVVVERNVRLTPASGTGEKREIDVLLTTNVVGYPDRWAIECKNEVKRVGPNYIDGFRGKLQQLGIPVQHGIFVSVSGYTQAALEAARDAGIQTFTLEDTTSRLNTALNRALQSTVYLLPKIGPFTAEILGIDELMTFEEGMTFVDESGSVRATLPDLVWHEWVQGRIPLEIGEREITFNIPDTWYQPHGGHRYRVVKVTVNVRVVGLVLTSAGSLSGHQLLSASDRTPTRGHLDASFTPLAPEKYPLTTVTSEEELQQLLSESAVIKITLRVPLPRINVWDTYYWPPSDRAMQYIAERLRAFEAGQIPDPRPFTIAEVEGTDLSTVWEGIILEHAAAELADSGRTLQ